jgi:cell division protein FtsN
VPQRECKEDFDGMSPKRKKTKKKKKFLELSFRSFFFWGLGLFLLMVWIFVLGVLVGRGLLSYEDMTDQFAKVQDTVGRKDSSDLDLTKDFDEDTKLSFYKDLSSKKDEAAKKNHIIRKKVADQKKPAKPLETAKPPTKKYEPLKGSQLDINKSRKKLDQDNEAPSFKTGGGYSVQVASFEKRLGAVKITDQLKSRGYPAYFLEVNIKGKVCYRVMCGNFKEREEASDYQKLLARQEKVHDCFVTRVD